MSVDTSSVIRTVSGEMYGFNNEWHNTDTIYLAEDYGKNSSFFNDFENDNNAYSDLDGNRVFHIKNVGDVLDCISVENISILNKTTCMSFRIKMQDMNGTVSLKLVQDSKENGRAQLTAVTLKDGKVYLGNEDTVLVSEYEKNTWYNIRYYLNTEDRENAKNILEIADENGNILGESNDTEIVVSDEELKKTLTFSKDSDYTYIITGGDGTAIDCHIDDIRFETLRDFGKTTQDYNIKPAIDMKDYPMGYSRMAGASAMTFDWKKSRGKLEERKPYEWTAGITEPAYCGIAEWVKTTKAVNENAKFSYVINLFDKDNDIVDLVEYLTSKQGEDINSDGIFWGDIRISDGIYEPVDISFWELGNEMDTAYGWNVEQYAQRCAEVIKILKKYAPNIPIAVHSITGGVNELARYNWCYSLLSVVGDDVDYITMHDYYLDDSFRDTQRYIKTIDGAVNCSYSQSMSLQNPKKWPHIKIMITEHSTARCITANGLIGGPSYDINDRSKWHRNYDLGAAVSNAEFYNRMLVMPVVAGTYYHAQSDIGPWQLIYTDTDGRMKPTLPYEVMKLYNDYGVGEVLKISLDGFLEDKNTDITASAVKNAEGEISLFFSNRASEPAMVNITGLDIGTMTKRIITSNSLDDYNYTDIFTVEKAEEETDFTGCVTLPAYSVVVLTINEKNTVVYTEYKGERAVIAYGNADSDVSLIITKDGKVEHFEQSKINENGEYRIKCETDLDVSECEIKLHSGVITDLTGKVKRITEPKELFDVEKSIEIGDRAKAQVKIKNPYSVKKGECSVVLAEYRGDRMINAYESGKITFSDGDNDITVSMDAVHPYNTFKAFVWTDLGSGEPLE